MSCCLIVLFCSYCCLVVVVLFGWVIFACVAPTPTPNPNPNTRHSALATDKAKADIERVEYDLHQASKKGLQQIEKLEWQVITEVEERLRVEGLIGQERRDMSVIKRDTDKQTRQLSIDRAQL